MQPETLCLELYVFRRTFDVYFDFSLNKSFRNLPVAVQNPTVI